MTQHSGNCFKRNAVIERNGRGEGVTVAMKATYVDARNNLHFVVTKEDIDKLVPKVELLRDITESIESYGEKE